MVVTMIVVMATNAAIAVAFVAEVEVAMVVIKYAGLPRKNRNPNKKG